MNYNVKPKLTNVNNVTKDTNLGPDFPWHKIFNHVNIVFHVWETETREYLVFMPIT